MLTEFDLFDGYSDDTMPVVMCGSGASYDSGCGALVANTYKGRENHVEFHSKIQDLLDKQ